MPAKIYYFPVKHQEPKEKPAFLVAAPCRQPVPVAKDIRDRFPKTDAKPWPATAGPCPWENIPEDKTVRPKFMDRRPWWEGLVDAIGVTTLYLSLLTILAMAYLHLVRVIKP